MLQVYGLNQFKRCAATYTRSYTVEDLDEADCHQHNRYQSDLDMDYLSY